MADFTAGLQVISLSNTAAFSSNSDTVSLQVVASDTTPPVFQSAATNSDGTKVILTYDEALSATVAAAGAFAVTTGGNANVVTAVATNGSTVELTLTNAVTGGQAVTCLLYTSRCV